MTSDELDYASCTLCKSLWVQAFAQRPQCQCKYKCIDTIITAEVKRVYLQNGATAPQHCSQHCSVICGCILLYIVVHRVSVKAKDQALLLPPEAWSRGGRAGAGRGPEVHVTSAVRR